MTKQRITLAFAGFGAATVLTSALVVSAAYAHNDQPAQACSTTADTAEHWVQATGHLPCQP
jgi:hypothetical protein